MCHRSVTGVTGDTTWHRLQQCPPFRTEPKRLRRRKKERNIHVGKKIPCLEQRLRKRESKKKKVQKVFNKILQVSPSKKKYWVVYPKGWGIRMTHIL